MTDQLRTRQDLIDNVFKDGPQPQRLTAQDIRDLIVSLGGVGAAESSEQSPIGTPVGLIRLGARRFQVAPNGDGMYLFVGQADGNTDIPTNVLAGFTVNDVDTTANYIRRAPFEPGDQNRNWVMLIDRPARDGWDGVEPPLQEGDIVELEFKTTGGAVLSNLRYFIFGIRLY